MPFLNNIDEIPISLGVGTVKSSYDKIMHIACVALGVNLAMFLKCNTQRAICLFLCRVSFCHQQDRQMHHCGIVPAIAKRILYPLNYHKHWKLAYKTSGNDLKIAYAHGASNRSQNQKKVQVGNDQEKVQSERNSHSKSRGGNFTNLRIL